MQKLNITIYDGRTLDGLVRTIVVRTGIRTGETQVVLVTTRKEIPHLAELITRIKKLIRVLYPLHKILTVKNIINLR